MAKQKQSKRTVVVFFGLVGVLTATSALLLAVAPAPLKPEGSSTLAASDGPPMLAGVFETSTKVQTGRWQYIYVRHSKSLQPNFTSNGDHFVIQTGSGLNDGQVQMTTRWMNQASAVPPSGVSAIDPKCISIVVVGDLDRNVPTPAQVQSVTSLVRTLQSELNVPAGRVLMVDQRNSAGGIGRFFPIDAFRENLLP